MSHREKVDRLVRELREKGISERMVAPPAFRLLWALGSEIPPPLFLPVERLLLLMGAFFGIFYTVIMWAVMRHYGVTFLHVLWPSALGSIAVGAILAFCFRWKAEKLNLPDWKDYDTSD
jgi:hypothetical protein